MKTQWQDVVIIILVFLLMFSITWGMDMKVEITAKDLLIAKQHEVIINQFNALDKSAEALKHAIDLIDLRDEQIVYMQDDIDYLNSMILDMGIDIQ